MRFEYISDDVPACIYRLNCLQWNENWERFQSSVWNMLGDWIVEVVRTSSFQKNNIFHLKKDIKRIRTTSFFIEYCYKLDIWTMNNKSLKCETIFIWDDFRFNLETKPRSKHVFGVFTGVFEIFIQIFVLFSLKFSLEENNICID